MTEVDEKWSLPWKIQRWLPEKVTLGLSVMDEDEFDIGLTWLRQGHLYLLIFHENITGNHKSKKVYISWTRLQNISHLFFNMVLLTSEEKDEVS